jgi:hypothetical protein
VDPVLSELVVLMPDPVMLGEAGFDETVVAFPAIGMDASQGVHLALDDGVQRCFGTVSNDLGMHPAAAFQDAKDGRLASGTPATFAADAGGAEEAFIDFHLAGEGAVTGSDLGHAGTEEGEQAQGGLAVEAGEVGGLRGGQISAEEAQALAEFGLRDARVAQIAVFLSHHSTLAGAQTT